MKKLIIAIMVLFLSSNVFAEKKVDIDLTTDFFSKYVSKGQNSVDEPVLQSSIDVKYKKLTLTVWKNLDLTDINDNKNNITEINTILDYSGRVFDFPKLNYSVGFINYDFPNTTSHNTSEIYVGLNFETFLNPSITVYRDIDEVDGTYVSFGVKYNFKNILSSLSIGWADDDYNNFYWSKDGDRFNDLTLSLSYPMKLKEWTISPSISYITLIDSEIRESNNYGKDRDFVVVGFRIVRSF